jgi:ribulose-phosphate 3-epimerase
MGIIVPAILPTSRHDLDEKLARLVGIATEVQVDIVDGVFASPASWPYASGVDEHMEGLTFSHLDDFRIEVDLMVKDPERVAGTWIAAGATRILPHLESMGHPARLITNFNTSYGHEKGYAPDLLSLGLAINVETDIQALVPYLEDIDYVQFMGITSIGKQGQPFAREVLDKIRQFRKAYPGTPIQVDGAVNFESAPLLLTAGVSRLVVGSALWNAPNLAEAYQRLTELTEEHGIYE